MLDDTVSERAADLIGKARESEYIRQALADEIVDTILRRLASL